MCRSMVMMTMLFGLAACGSGESSHADAGAGGQGSGGTAGAGGSGGKGSGGSGGGSLKWYTTCGDPVCRIGDAGAQGGSVARCTNEQTGQTCTSESAMCDPGTGCGEKLVCASADPKQRVGGCPI